MFVSVLPLKMIVFQSLLLLMAIAIEAYVLRYRLSLTQKRSVHYATSINFLSTTVGWLLFLIIQPLIPPGLKLQLIDCIFFDHWQQGFILWVMLSAPVTFFVSFFVKLFGLTYLQFFLGDIKPPETDAQKAKSTKFGANRRTSRSMISPGLGNAILAANALSYSAVSLILIIRLVTQGSLDLEIQ
ncbi:hypothetical protein H6G89_03105 [Oscillatoria sp. FACHB-1407]|uniref:filament integrity protein FraC n=1 Tax=Oscillatoria sp. FACHB-1407 TaxID=2692847 RepID=UPI00168A2DAD|nr:filament integrity protein FraC [Oscillatoria sp. FACHB-1407]MBD2460024.1 hypothetical protein [Oscillatoria sp. FACHB-1407]